MGLIERTDNSGIIVKWDGNTLIVNFQNVKREISPSTAQEAKVSDEKLNEFEKFIFSSTNRELRFSDMFVWPDFKAYNKISSKEEDIVGEYDSVITAENDKIFIVWSELSGKTSVARKIYLESHSRGFHPFFIEWSTITSGNLNFEKFFKKEFSVQYSGDPSKYWECQQKIVIIDDFHHEISSNFLSRLEEFFDKVILLVNEEEHSVYFNDERYAEYELYRIQGFTSAKQHDLIANWICWGSKNVHWNDVYNNRFDEIEARINDTIINKQVVPRTPFYILTIIQTFESYSAKADLAITSYWHCYQALLVVQLSKKWILPGEMHECLTYLMRLAYFIFKNGKDKKISLADYSKFKADYSQKYLKIEKSVIQKLEHPEHPILRKNDVELRFEFEYAYYYFVWEYIAKEKDFEPIERLCDTLHKKDNANILIFTIHHSSDNRLLDEIQLHCMTTFDGRKAVMLTKYETQFMIQSIVELPKTILNGKTVKENRLSERQKMDEANDVEDWADDGKEGSLREMLKSFRVIEVLWQILKNRAGDLERSKAEELLFEIELLGLRLIGHLLDTIQSEEFKSFLQTRLDSVLHLKWVAKKIVTQNDKQDFIGKLAQRMAMSIIHGILFKVYQSVNAKKLMELQASIARKNPEPAFELLNLLFKIGNEEISFEFIKGLVQKYKEEGNIWASHALSYYVQFYLNTHDVDYRIRQKMCGLLGIQHVANRFQLWR